MEGKGSMPAGRFSKVELVRALDAVKTAGLPVSKVEIDPDGTIRIFISQDEDGGGPSPLDLIDWTDRRTKKGPKGR